MNRSGGDEAPVGERGTVMESLSHGHGDPRWGRAS